MFVFIILNYMTAGETASLAKKILLLNKYTRVIIVDNCSPDKSGVRLMRDFEDEKRVDIILNNKNEGFAKGNNLGYKRALKYKPGYIILLNSDIEFSNTMLLENIKSVYKQTGFAVMGPKIIVPETGISQNPKSLRLYSREDLLIKQRQLTRKLDNKKRLKIRAFFKQFTFIRKNYLKVKSKKSIEITYNREVATLHGSFVVFSKKFISKFDEPFDERTFFYFEMEILGVRLKKNNLTSVYCPSITVLHHQNLSTRKAFNNEYNKTVFQIKKMLESIKIALSYY